VVFGITNFVLGSNNKFFHCGLGDQEKWPKFKILSNFYKTWYMEVFEVATNEYDVKNSKFKMGDPTWQLKLTKISRFV